MAIALLLALGAAAGCSSTSSDTPHAERSALRRINWSAVQTTLDATASSLLVPGAVVLVPTPSGTHTLSYGSTTLGRHDAPDGHTFFRIGSGHRLLDHRRAARSPLPDVARHPARSLSRGPVDVA